MPSSQVASVQKRKIEIKSLRLTWPHICVYFIIGPIPIHENGSKTMFRPSKTKVANWQLFSKKLPIGNFFPVIIKVDILKFPEWYNVIQISQGMYFNFVNFRRKSKIPKSLILLSTRSFLAKF